VERIYRHKKPVCGPHNFYVAPDRKTDTVLAPNFEVLKMKKS
jgi:hypothetical protein